MKFSHSVSQDHRVYARDNQSVTFGEIRLYGRDRDTNRDQQHGIRRMAEVLKAAGAVYVDDDGETDGRVFECKGAEIVVFDGVKFISRDAEGAITAGSGADDLGDFLGEQGSD